MDLPGQLAGIDALVADHLARATAEGRAYTASAYLTDFQENLNRYIDDYLVNVETLPPPQHPEHRDALRERVLGRIQTAADDWRATLGSDDYVVLKASPVCHAALAARLHPATLQVAHPGLAYDATTRRLTHQGGQPLLLCPAVLAVLHIVPAEAVLSDATLDLVVDAIRRYTQVSGAHADVLPHNWGFASLLWQPGNPRLVGHDPDLFDAKHRRDPPDWQRRLAERSRRPGLRLALAWTEAATWRTACAEYDRQPALRGTQRPLYRQFWHAAQQSLGPAMHTLTQAFQTIIKLGLLLGLDQAPANLAQVHRTLDLRLAL